MATATSTQYTPEDLLKITDRPMPELVDGRLVEREMGQKLDAIAARVLRLIGNHVEANRLGLVNGAQGSYQIFPDDPQKVRIPDVSFTKRDRLPATGPAEGHARIAPDLVVEVISPNDLAEERFLKVWEWLEAGVPLVWVVNPKNRTLRIYRADRTGILLGPGDILEGGNVLPGFLCTVAELFE